MGSRRTRLVDALTLARLARRLGVSVRELTCLRAIILLGAVLRLVNLPARGGWDSDQGTSMLDLHWALSTGQLPTFGPLSSIMTFHHGALYYDLMLVAAWLGNGDPVWVVGEIAFLSLLVIPSVWWISRTIGGTAAGLTAALLAATSASLISYATFIWNPTIVEPGAAIAFLGAWQAIRTQRASWWLLAAIGGAVAAQGHIAGGMIVLPLAAAFLLDLRRGPAGRRRRILAWGAVGVVLFVATYLPLIVWEFGHNFTETRGILAYFTAPGSPSSVGPLVRLLFAAVRILAWPLTRWPIVDLESAFLVAFATATAIAMGMVWLLGVTARRDAPEAHDPAEGLETEEPEAATGSTAPARSTRSLKRELSLSTERLGVRLVGGWLLLLVLALGLGLHAVSEVQGLPTEQYHVVADPLVFVAVGLIAGGLWRPLPRQWLTVLRRAATVVALGTVLAWNAAHLPPLTATDGGWPAAQVAAVRLERDAGGSAMALVPLFALKGSDAYLYPLTRDGFTLVTPGEATTVALLCDTFWLTGCGGTAEATWLATNPAGAGLVRIDQFAAAPDRILTVYRRGP